MIVAAPGRTKIYIDSILDSIESSERGPRGMHPHIFQKPAEVFDTPPQQRLADQIEAMLKKWAERGIS